VLCPDCELKLSPLRFCPCATGPGKGRGVRDWCWKREARLKSWTDETLSTWNGSSVGLPTCTRKAPNFQEKWIYVAWNGKQMRVEDRPCYLSFRARKDHSMLTTSSLFQPCIHLTTKGTWVSLCPSTTPRPCDKLGERRLSLTSIEWPRFPSIAQVGAFHKYDLKNYEYFTVGYNPRPKCSAAVCSPVL